MIISIIIPCYNHGRFLLEALESVETAKGEFPCEVIIVNDGSTEQLTKEVLADVEKRGYRVIHQYNQGLAAARNNAIKAAKGKYILPLDTDNKLHRNYFDAIDVLEKNSSVDVVYGNPILFGDEKGLKEVGDFEIEKLLHCNYIDACAVFRKEVWERVNGYDANMPAMGNEDWEFWWSVFFTGGMFLHLDKPCFYYRVRHDSMSFTTTKPGFAQNKQYLYAKHGEKLVNFYLERKATLDYINNNRAKAIIKLMLGRAF